MKKYVIIAKSKIGATSRAFWNGRNLKMYVDDCFEVLNSLDEQLPATYIRIDVAHIINILPNKTFNRYTKQNT